MNNFFITKHNHVRTNCLDVFWKTAIPKMLKPSDKTLSSEVANSKPIKAANIWKMNSTTINF